MAGRISLSAKRTAAVHCACAKSIGGLFQNPHYPYPWSLWPLLSWFSNYLSAVSSLSWGLFLFLSNHLRGSDSILGPLFFITLIKNVMKSIQFYGFYHKKISLSLTAKHYLYDILFMPHQSMMLSYHARAKDTEIARC